MPDPTFFAEGNTPRLPDSDWRVEQKILGALRTAPSGGDPTDPDLVALAAMSCTGLIARTAPATFVCRSLVAPAAGITIADANGVAGNPIFALANDLLALENLAATGLAVRTAADTWAQRSIAAGVGIDVTNGDGVAGNPTLALNINGLTAETTAADGDFLAIYDVSASAHRKMTRANLLAGLSSAGSRRAAANLDADISIPHDTFVDVPFAVEEFDNDSIWAVGTPTRFTINTGGVYKIGAFVSWEISAAYYWEATLVVRNASEGAVKELASFVNVGADNIGRASIDSVYQLSATQRVYLRVKQQSGSTKALHGGNGLTNGITRLYVDGLT